LRASPDHEYGGGAESLLDEATAAHDGACAAAMNQVQLPRAVDLDSGALSLRRKIQVDLVLNPSHPAPTQLRFLAAVERHI
jgi:hypothetical protein